MSPARNIEAPETIVDIKRASLLPFRSESCGKMKPPTKVPRFWGWARFENIRVKNRESRWKTRPRYKIFFHNKDQIQMRRKLRNSQGLLWSICYCRLCPRHTRSHFSHCHRSRWIQGFLKEKAFPWRRMNKDTIVWQGHRSPFFDIVSCLQHTLKPTKRSVLFTDKKGSLLCQSI